MLPAAGPDVPWLDSQDLADLTADTKSRLARPDLFLITILRRYWNEATAEEACSVWQGTVRSHPSYAIDVLNGLYQITQDPPENLVTLIVDQGRGDLLQAHHSRQQTVRRGGLPGLAEQGLRGLVRELRRRPSGALSRTRSSVGSARTAARTGSRRCPRLRPGGRTAHRSIGGVFF